MSKRNVWDNAKLYSILGWDIYVLRNKKSEGRRFYSELYKKGLYQASYGSDLPLHWLVAIETYLKRGQSCVRH